MSKAIFPALAILAITCSTVAAMPANPHKRHRAVAGTSPTATSKRPTALTRSAPVKTTGKTARGSSSRSAHLPAATAARRKKGKTTHAVSRSYQQAPTPDRYREIQQALATKGYFHGDPNGQWGSDSADAMKRFQADQNLMPDGKINSLSLIALGLGPKRLTAKSDAVPPAQPPPAAVPPGATAPTAPAATPSPAPPQ